MARSKLLTKATQILAFRGWKWGDRWPPSVPCRPLMSQSSGRRACCPASVCTCWLFQSWGARMTCAPTVWTWCARAHSLCSFGGKVPVRAPLFSGPQSSAKDTCVLLTPWCRKGTWVNGVPHQRSLCTWRSMLAHRTEHPHSSSWFFSKGQWAWQSKDRLRLCREVLCQNRRGQWLKGEHPFWSCG